MGLYIKEFNEKKVILSNGEKDFLLEALDDNTFDRDTIEDILNCYDEVDNNEDKSI